MPDSALPAADQQFRVYVQQLGQQLHKDDRPPTNLADWQIRKQTLRKNLLAAWGGFPAEPCELAPRVVGELRRPGYRIEKLLLQTRPGIWMTANAYIPDGQGKRPAVLCVHGHWPKAKQDPVVQDRCLGLVKLGFFVLAVDAFGAGERAIGKALGEYHGEMVAATLLPVGLPLSGLQVYENMRAVDYLQTRPEVDGSKIGITGASGGGNQTMYAGAFDERFACVVPVCSVGTYQAYLRAACCMCEVVPGALQFTEEAGILGLVAPRGLMIINATKDAFQFSIGEAEKSIAAARTVFELLESSDHLRHTTFESPHAYNQPMREAMYGWMTLHLKGEGKGDPIPEPEHQTEDPELLRCFPEETRPDDWVTLPKFAAAESRAVLKKLQSEKHQHIEHWQATEQFLRFRLDQLLGGVQPHRKVSVQKQPAAQGAVQTYLISPEPGIQISAVHHPGKRKEPKTAVILDMEGTFHAADTELVKELKATGWDVVFTELRATGQYAVLPNKVGRAPDHNSAEWSLWLGRPMLGQWVRDVHAIFEALAEQAPQLVENLHLVGLGPAGTVALAAAVFDERVAGVACIGSLASLVTETPYQNQRLGILVPGSLRKAGDLAQWSALLAPRRLVMAAAVQANAEPLSQEELHANFAYTRGIYRLQQAEQNLSVISEGTASDILSLLADDDVVA